MEDERDAGGHSNSGGVSEPPLSGKLPDERVAEVMDGDNRSEEVFAEGDGEEIMVEVVGSDVYVDGVSGNGEGDCEMAEVAGISPMDISEEKNTKGVAVDKDVSDVKADIAEGKEILPQSDNSTSHVRLVVDSARADGKTEETHDVIRQVDSVNPSGGELPDPGTQKEGSFMAEVESPNTDGDSGIQGKSVLEKNVRAAESKDPITKPDAHTDVCDVHVKDVNAAETKASIPKSDAPADVLDESQNCSDDLRGAKLEPNDETDGVSHNVPESILENYCDTQKGETEGNDECSKTEDDVDAVKAQNQVITSIPVQIADGGDAVEVSKDEHLNVDVKDVARENVQNKTVKNVVIPLVKDMDGGESGEKGMDLDSEILGKSLAGHGNAEIPAQNDAAENMPLQQEGASSEVKMADTMVAEDPVPCHDPNSEGVANIGECGSPKSMKEVVASQVSETLSHEATPMEVEEERDSDKTYHPGQDVDTETAIEGPSFESDKLEMSNVETVKYSGSLRMKQLGYLNSPEDEDSFAPSDLIWGKVRSHPWWPGQIFDPENASEKAVKHHKKDSYLVAYFGDQTFAWNDSSALKPFRSHFSQIEKQSNSESFHNAVNCALEEVKRRVQLGLSCSCVPKDDYAKIGTQVLENTGIREESSQRSGLDQSSCASHFEPSELLEFIRAAASCASSGADRLDLVIARAQLSTFCSFKGYRPPTEFPSSGELLEIDRETEQISDEAVASHKLRHIPKEFAQSRKERSLMELMGDREYSPDAEDESVTGDLGKSVSSYTGKKRKALDPLAEGSDKRASVSAPTSQTPKPSFKIGECIRRVANKLTGSTPLVKGGNDEMAVDGSPSVYEPSEKQSVVVSTESLSPRDTLSQLELLAQDPKKRHTSEHQIRAFFMGFRKSTTLSRRGRKKKSERAIGEEFEFDDVNDSYWTDRIVQNYSAEQLLHERMDGSGSLHVVPFNMEITGKAGRKPHSRKRFFSENSPTSAPESEEKAKRIKQESSPAELILSFAERNVIPSEINLNKMFRRFGHLMESETEVDHESGSAKVIFKRGSDAEVARNSAEKFSIFGPVVVSYQIGYSPVISVKILPVSLPQSQEEATLML